MDKPEDNKVDIQVVWGKGANPGYMQIGSFQHEASDWPLIYVTVPIEWAEAHRDLWNDIVIRAAKEFIRRYNAGQISEKGDGVYKM